MENLSRKILKWNNLLMFNLLLIYILFVQPIILKMHALKTNSENVFLLYKKLCFSAITIMQLCLAIYK